MEEKSKPLRRSRRAASLTAQVLWNYQIQEDSSLTSRSGHMTSNAKVSSNSMPKESARPHSVAMKETVSTKQGLSPSVSTSSATTQKRGRKRKVLPVLSKSVMLSCSDEAEEKKRKLSTQRSVFPIRKPLQSSSTAKSKGKLTASVAPLIKPQPTTTVKTVNTSVTNITHSNPILLLPVSLQGNSSIEGVQNQNVGGLSLVTLQASPDFLNCLRLNKTIPNSTGTSGQWASRSSNMVGTHAVPLQFNVKSSGSVVANRTTPLPKSTPIKHKKMFTDNVTVQLEPLNLKVGETTVSNSSKTVPQKATFAQARLLKPVTVTYPRIMPKEKVEIVSTKHTGTTAIKQKEQHAVIKLLQRAATQVKSQRGNKPNIITTSPSKKQTLSATTSRKRIIKCPSPDYDCSSPDVDDVQRNPRHSCNRRQIKLRNKAAPPPGSREYLEFVEQQRQLLLDIKRAQRAKAKARAKLEAKKTKLKRRQSDDDDRPLSAIASSERFKPQTPETSSKHSWEWWGKQYTSSVYSGEAGKYVSRCCYPAIRRKDEENDSLDVILVRDSVFLLPGGEEDELSYVAKVSALWEHPNTKEMMMSVIWYYRPEQTRDYNGSVACEDEIYASKHQDEISVACIEQRCKVLTYLRFCRLQAKIHKDRLWRKSDLRRIVPPLQNPTTRRRPAFPREDPLDPNDMFYSRQYYDVHSHRVKSKLRFPSSLSQEHAKRSVMTSLTST